MSVIAVAGRPTPRRRAVDRPNYHLGLAAPMGEKFASIWSAKHEQNVWTAGASYPSASREGMQLLSMNCSFMNSGHSPCAANAMGSRQAKRRELKSGASHGGCISLGDPASPVLRASPPCPNCLRVLPSLNWGVDDASPIRCRCDAFAADEPVDSTGGPDCWPRLGRGRRHNRDPW